MGRKKDLSRKLKDYQENIKHYEEQIDKDNPYNYLFEGLIGHEKEIIKDMKEQIEEIE